MKINAIAIEREKNPIYFSLLAEHNLIMAEYDRINRLILDYHIPKLILYGQGKKIGLLGKQVKELHDRFLLWDKEISVFTIHPNLIFPEDVDANTSFSHYTDVLRDVRLYGTYAFDSIIVNYQGVYNSYASQVNFLIAMFSFVASFAGLIASLVGLIIALKLH
jgi:hypothetical protein